MVSSIFTTVSAMVDPTDVESCFDAMLRARELRRLKVLSWEEVYEIDIAMKQIAKNYIRALMGANLRPDDAD